MTLGSTTPAWRSGIVPLKKDTDEALRELLEDIKTDIERFLRNTADENDWRY